MDKFEIGDRVVFTDENVNTSPWRNRRTNKTPGKIVSLDVFNTAKIEFEDTLAVDGSGTGWSGLNQIEHLFERDQIVTGQPKFPIGSEVDMTGPVINGDYEALDGTRVVLIRAPGGQHRYLLWDTVTPVRVPKLNQEEETTVTQERAFVGKAPEPTEGPEYVLPFKTRDGDTVTDANNLPFAATSFCTSFVKDKQAAEIVRDALNAYFADSDPVEPKPDPVKPLRTLFTKGEDGRVTHSGMYPFVYEVAPGRFWGATSRAQAMAWAAGGGWAADEYNNLYDVEDPDGPQVVS